MQHLFQTANTFCVRKVQNLHIPTPHQNKNLDPNQEGDKLHLDTSKLSSWNVNQVLSFVKSFDKFKAINTITLNKLKQSTLKHEYGLNGFIVQHVLESDTQKNPKQFGLIFPEMGKEEVSDFFMVLNCAFAEEIKYFNQLGATLTFPIPIDEILEKSLGVRNESLPEILRQHLATNPCEGTLFPKFIDREYFVQDTLDFCREIMTYYGDLKKAIENKSEEPLVQPFQIASVFNGAGAGKTRACKEITNILRNDLGSNSDNLVATCYIDFSNHLAVTDEDTKEFDSLTACAHTSLILGYRILGGLGLKPNDEYKLCPVLAITKVLKWISNTLKLNENGKTLYLVLCFDEFQEIMEKFPNGWKALCREIEYYMKSRISNKRLELNPISNSGVSEMVKMYFENQKISFKDGTIDQFYTADILLNYPMTRLFFVALGRVPKILVLSLNELKHNFFNQHSLEDWHSITNAQNMLRKMVDLIENDVTSQKYSSALTIKDDEDDGLFNVVYGAVEFVEDRHKCQIPLKTHTNILEMLKKGQLYRTRENTIYCTYFHFKNLLTKFASNSELINTYNFGKQISTSGDSFEVIDVGAIKARIKTLAGGTATATASVGELFPGICCHDLLRDLELKLPQIDAYRTSSDVLKQVAFTTKEDEKVLVLLQYKLREANVKSVSELFPPSLFKTKKELYKGYRTIYLLITNSRTDFNFTQQCNDEYRQNIGLICYIENEDTKNPALTYFAPNLYPFYKDLEARTPLPTNQPNVGVFSNYNIIKKPTKRSTEVLCKCRTKGCKQEIDDSGSKHSCDCLKNNKSCSERCQCKGCFYKVNEEEKEDSYTQSKKKLKTK